MFNFSRKDIRFWPKLSVKDFLVLIAGLAVFGGIAASTITKFSVWFDEGFGSYIVRFNFFDLTRYTANDVHPPFYYWLLKIWTVLFGNTELGIRSMSLFFGVVTIAVAFLFVLRFFGRRVAYISLIFLVLSPFFIRYSQEARMYTLLSATIITATYVLVYAHQNQKKRWPWIVYGVFVTLGMLTQYFAALAWIAHWVWRFIIIRKPGEPWKKSFRNVLSKNWIIAHIVAVGLFLPWLPFMAIQFFTIQGHGFWISPVTTSTIPDFFTDILSFTDHRGAFSWLAIAFFILLGSFIYIAIKLLKSLKGEDRNNYLLIIALIIVPTVLLFIMSLPPLRSAFIDRYLIEVAIFLPLFFGVSLAFSRTLLAIKTSVFIGAMVIAVMIVGIVNQMIIGNYNKSSNQSNNVRQLVEAVRATSPNTPIVASTPWIFYESVIYETTDSPIYFVNETTQYKYGSLTMLAENDQNKIKDVDMFSKQNTSFWVISNLRDTPPKALRSSWHAQESIVINDDQTKQPLFKATHFTVE